MLQYIYNYKKNQFGYTPNSLPPDNDVTASFKKLSHPFMHTKTECVSCAMSHSHAVTCATYWKCPARFSNPPNVLQCNFWQRFDFKSTPKIPPSLSKREGGFKVHHIVIAIICSQWSTPQLLCYQCYVIYSIFSLMTNLSLILHDFFPPRDLPISPRMGYI